MKSATASANEREDDKERKNDEVEARNRPENTPARKEDNRCPDVSCRRCAIDDGVPVAVGTDLPGTGKGDRKRK